jgi:hypothetical protein
MKAATLSLTLAAVLTGSVAAQAPACKFSVSVEPDAVAFHLVTDTTPALGAVVVSLSPELTHYFVGLPPILTDFVVLSVTVMEEPELQLVLPARGFPPGLFVYAQGLIGASSGIAASAVADFVLDAGPPVH